MTKKKQKKVYVPPVAEQLAIVEEIQLLGSSQWDGKYGMQHTKTTTSQEEVVEEGLEITSKEAYQKGW